MDPIAHADFFVFDSLLFVSIYKFSNSIIPSRLRHNSAVQLSFFVNFSCDTQPSMPRLKTLSSIICKHSYGEILRESMLNKNLETKRQQSPSDRLHWSFSDGPNLTKIVFPEGFSSEESTLFSGKIPHSLVVNRNGS